MMVWEVDGHSQREIYPPALARLLSQYGANIKPLGFGPEGHSASYSYTKNIDPSLVKVEEVRVE